MINWKIRLKNPVFYAQMILSVIAPVLAYMGITIQDLSTWYALGEVIINALKNPYVLSLVMISVYNAMIDPTSTGISDSKIARLYTTPNNVKE